MIVDTVVAFIEPAQVDGTEEDIPRASSEGFETDGQFAEDVGDVDPPGVPANAAVAGDAPGFEVAGVLDRQDGSPGTDPRTW